MLVIFGILIIIASVALGLIVLIQNPKGGGLSGTFGGVGNQLMGVKQTTDVLEKGTWIFAGAVGLLCILSPIFIPKSTGSSSKNDELIKSTPASIPAAPGANSTVPLPNSKDTTKR
jgi:preprotein translocase subunit SecG